MAFVDFNTAATSGVSAKQNSSFWDRFNEIKSTVQHDLDYPSDPITEKVIASNGFNKLLSGAQAFADRYDKIAPTVQHDLDYPFDPITEKVMNSESFNKLNDAAASSASTIKAALSGALGNTSSTTGVGNVGDPIGGSNATSDAPSSASDVFDYYYAPYAEHYGMDKETAYQEALANTSYQRAMSDMLAAGINPALLASRGFGNSASGVYGASEAVSNDSVVTPASSGSSGSGSSGSKKSFDFVNLAQGVASIFAGAIALATTKNPAAVATAASVAGTSAKYLAKAFSN